MIDWIVKKLAKMVRDEIHKQKLEEISIWKVASTIVGDEYFSSFINENIRNIHNEKIQGTVNEFVYSEAFIDQVVERIKRKQLG